MELFVGSGLMLILGAILAIAVWHDTGNIQDTLLALVILSLAAVIVTSLCAILVMLWYLALIALN
jgi:hypothetical protein